jgi:hypothetical protein
MKNDYGARTDGRQTRHSNYPPHRRGKARRKVSSALPMPLANCVSRTTTGLSRYQLAAA